MVTKIDLIGTETFFILLIKWFASLICEGIFLPHAGNGDQWISKLLCETHPNLSLVIQYYLVYEFSVQYKMLVFLGYLILDHLQFF